MTHRDGPVQPGRNAPFWPFILAAMVAFGLWSWNNRPDEPGGSAGVAGEAPALPLSKRASGELAGLFSEKDYPRASIAAREEGVVEFELSIDRRGRADCRVVASSGFERLDRATCAVLDKVRLEPALDANGAAAPDQLRSRVRWVLPK